MSRLDAEYIHARGARTWTRVFTEASECLGVPASSFKNLRDEFDPLHANRRKGWRRRPLRPSRQNVLVQLQDLSDEALLALVDKILARNEDVTVEAVDSLAGISTVVHNVAERLLTGKRAEEYFLRQCNRLIGVHRSSIVDLRNSAMGFDFGVSSAPELAIEVKGLKTLRGAIQFTDREWREARVRLENYWLVVVGGLGASPKARVFKNPHGNLRVDCKYVRSVSAIWRSNVKV